MFVSVPKGDAIFMKVRNNSVAVRIFSIVIRRTRVGLIG